MKALGIDPGAKTGWSLVARPPHQQEQFVRCGILKGDNPDAIREFVAVTWEENPDLSLVIIERPFLFKSPRVLAVLSMLVGALRYAFSERVRVDLVDPSEWRAQVLALPPRMKRDDCKRAARAWVQAKFDRKLSEDESEATCMAFFGVRRLLFTARPVPTSSRF